MTEALSYIYYSFDKMLNLFFNELTIESNVTLGWVIFAVLLFSFIIANVLSVPSAIRPDLYYGDSRANKQIVNNRKKGWHHG